MHRDFTIGLVTSVLLHFGTLYGDRYINFSRTPAPKPPVERTLDLIEMPRFEPEQLDRALDEEAPPKLDFERPQIIDLPQAVIGTVFSQPVQPLPADRRSLMPGILDALAIPGDIAPTEIFDPRNLDQIPRIRFRTPPTYPFEMRREHIEGEVTIGFLVDAEGNVQDAGAITSTHRAFEAPALSAVSKWKFRPGRKNGQAVVTRMQVPIVFSLDR